MKENNTLTTILASLLSVLFIVLVGLMTFNLLEKTSPKQQLSNNSVSPTSQIDQVSKSLDQPHDDDINYSNLRGTIISIDDSSINVQPDTPDGEATPLAVTINFTTNTIFNSLMVTVPPAESSKITVDQLSENDIIVVYSAISELEQSDIEIISAAEILLLY